MAGQIIKPKRKDGSFIEDTWYVRIFLGREADGKRRYFTKTIHGKKKDADKYLTAKIVLTLDTYSHVLPNMQLDATTRIEKLMFGT